MPTKPENRDYQREAARETEERKEARRQRQRARYALEKERGSKVPTDMHVDHKKPISKGGTNARSNLRVISDKQNESFRRNGPGGKPK